jgi:hypothetical protein
MMTIYTLGFEKWFRIKSNLEAFIPKDLGLKFSLYIYA